MSIVPFSRVVEKSLFAIFTRDFALTWAEFLSQRKSCFWGQERVVADRFPRIGMSRSAYVKIVYFELPCGRELALDLTFGDEFFAVLPTPTKCDEEECLA
jgi:hypothetical protein